MNQDLELLWQDHPQTQPSKSWLGSVLPNPGKFEDINSAARGCVGTEEVFDGLRFEWSQTITERLFSTHSISLASSQDPPSYSFSPNFMNNPNFFMFGKVDDQSRVLGRMMWRYSDDLELRAGAQVAGEDFGSQAYIECDYGGFDWTGQFKIGTAGLLELSYLQSVTQKLALGIDLYHHSTQGITISTLGGRWTGNKWWGTLTGASVGVITASYAHQLTEKMSMGTEYTLGMNPQHGTLESETKFGYAFRQSEAGSFKAVMTSNWKVLGVLELILGPNMKLLACADTDHQKEEYKMGLAFQLFT